MKKHLNTGSQQRKKCINIGQYVFKSYEFSMLNFYKMLCCIFVCKIMLKLWVLNVKTRLLYCKPKLILKTLSVLMSANTAECFWIIYIYILTYIYIYIYIYGQYSLNKYAKIKIHSNIYIYIYRERERERQEIMLSLDPDVRKER